MMMQTRITRFFQKFPGLGKWVIRIYRYTQPCYSVGVSGILLDGQGRVLLVEHVFHMDQRWGLPGGWVGRHEAPQDAVCREFQEETRLRVRIVAPLMVKHSARWKSHLDIFFLVEQLSEEDKIQLCFELSDYRWCALDALPLIKDSHRQALDLVRNGSEVMALNAASK